MVDSTTVSHNSAYYYGGAIYDIVYYRGNNILNLAIRQSYFGNNHANRDGGGAVYVNSPDKLVSVIGSSFINNTAYNFGGAVFVVGESSSVRVTGSSFITNTAVYRRRRWSYLLQWTLCECNTVIINIH